MNPDEAMNKLSTLPWQALYNLAIEKNVAEEDINGKEKAVIIRKLLLSGISEDEINTAVDDYIYGMRVTFTLWGFSRDLIEEDFSLLLDLSGIDEPWIEVDGFRNLQYISVKRHTDRLEILYSYSKEYSYINEKGHADSVWELHRGCLWIGIDKNYLASISKHEKMMTCIIKILGEKLGVSITQQKPPKKAIEKCANFQAMSRIVLQGTGGEKTAISNSGGFTEEQQEEMQRIQQERFDTSGSYIAAINESTTATVKYNVKKGNIGIYKHLSSNVLFEWSRKAIEIILDEIENLKGKPATEIFQEMGVEIKWPGYSTASNMESLNWILTQTINSLNEKGEYRVSFPKKFRSILENEKLFIKIPMVYCQECELYVIPYCGNCGEKLTYNRKGMLECSCNAPLKVTCAEYHKGCKIEPWFVPQKRLLEMVNQNIRKIFRDHELNYKICVVGGELYIVPSGIEEAYPEVEISFSDITCFQGGDDILHDEVIKSFAVRMNEKCDKTCSYEKIERCIHDPSMYCLPKVFYGIIPAYKPQPHKGDEFGDVSGQIQVGENYYQMIGIIKKNSENTNRRSKPKPDEVLIQKPLLSTAKEGEEIIRQFVQQGMVDNRVDVIAIIAPQYFDQGLKATLHMLAKLAHKKVLFIELDEVCKLIAMNSNVKVE